MPVAPDIPAKLLTRMTALFNSHKNLLAVILHGPRATGQAREEDSIRLGVVGPLKSRDIRQLRHQLGQLHTSIHFDLTHMDHLADAEQRQLILDEGIELFRRKGS